MSMLSIHLAISDKKATNQHETSGISYTTEIEQYGDQHSNQMRKTVEYGNPVQHTGKQGTGHGRIAPGTIDAGLAGQQHGQLRRSGSSGSSSLEDDGQCGRRKKGLKDKMKEKLPRGHKDEQNYGTQTTTPAGGYGYGGREHHEKKGVVEKIKKRRPLDDITMSVSNNVLYYVVFKV
ncbi:dehydrin DHN1-like [Forsythia ovata]|uniref:Dehydrin DHN1-like n=1 Tax=Forsythia ovata TaxID=205694 RepID=A0ABD1U661_9LAMI